MAALARSVLVTGSSRGIGLELVRQLAASPRPPQHIFATCRDPKGPRGKVSAGTGNGMVLSQVGGGDPQSPQPWWLVGLGGDPRSGGRSALGSPKPPRSLAKAAPSVARWDVAGEADMSSALAPGCANGQPTPFLCWDHSGWGAVLKPS